MVNTSIKAKDIIIGAGTNFGENVLIDVTGTFTIGSHSYIGPNSRIEGRNVKIGSHFYNSGGLRAGVGRKPWPNANLTIGDRCTTHNNFIDLAREVIIGDDVGLSPETAIYNHGYWMSVLDGNPTTYEKVRIGNRVIVGFRCTLLPGITIGNNTVVGSNSVITKDLEGGFVYAGNPARAIRKIMALTKEEKVNKIKEILDSYKMVCEYRENSPNIGFEYPNIYVNSALFNVEEQFFLGLEDEETDDFRDFIFRYGIRFYSSRGFRIHLGGI